MKKRIVKIIALALCLVAITTMFSACSEAEKVNYNMSKQAQYFECLRKITVYNARTDTIVLEAEGYMDISNNTTNELVVTCKVGANEYKKNYVYLNEWTIYVVEDITGTYTDPYHYKMYFHTEILPDVEIKP
jgi:curli biogenesis system outer membrane secretion channel CsgG